MKKPVPNPYPTKTKGIFIGVFLIITNSLRDIMSGDYISGMARMLEALLTATFIAAGVGIMMVILGG